MTSYADLFGIVVVEDGNVAVGDVVITGNNDYPRYEVLALHDGRAWVRSTDHDWDAVVDQVRLRKLNRL